MIVPLKSKGPKQIEFRSSNRRCSAKKGLLRNFVKLHFKNINSKEVINHGDVVNQWVGEILKTFFYVKNVCWKPCSCCKETIVVFILRIIIVVLILRTDYRCIYSNKIYNHILRIAYSEHFVTLKHLYWYSIKIKLTNTLTQLEPMFQQNQMSPAILQLIEKPFTWFDMLNTPTGFYMCPKRTSADHWSKMGET